MEDLGRKSTFEMHTLLLCSDVQFLGATRGVLRQLGVTPRIVADCEAAMGLIEAYEFDTIVVDWREIHDLGHFLRSVRRSKMNQDCILVAIVHDLLDLRQAFAAGVHLLVHKPASVVQIERCLRAAYCASVARRRKHHREPVSLAASFSARNLPMLAATVVNLGEGGARVKMHLDSGRLDASVAGGDEVEICFTLPGSGELLHCTGIVVWTNTAGEAGLRFTYIPDDDRLALEQWLTARVEHLLAELCRRVRAVSA